MVRYWNNTPTIARKSDQGWAHRAGFSNVCRKYLASYISWSFPHLSRTFEQQEKKNKEKKTPIQYNTHLTPQQGKRIRGPVVTSYSNRLNVFLSTFPLISTSLSRSLSLHFLPFSLLLSWFSIKQPTNPSPRRRRLCTLTLPFLFLNR